MTLHEFFLTVLLIFPHKVEEKSDFYKAIPYVLKHEGGLSNDKDDKGGITNFGISYSFLKNAAAKEKDIMKEVDLNHNNKIDSYDVRYMTKKEAQDLYKKEFWDKYGYGAINYQPLATKILDISVNMGPTKATSLLRKACKGYNYPLVDSKSPYLRKHEADFLNSLPVVEQDKIISNIITLSIDFYEYLAKKNPSQRKFLKGWIKRARESL